MFSLSYFVIYYIYVRRPQNKSINEIVSLEQILACGCRFGILLFEAIETIPARPSDNILDEILFKLTNIPK